MSENPLLALAGSPAVRPDGTMAIPDAPGLGLELAAESLQPWLVEHWSVRC